LLVDFNKVLNEVEKTDSLREIFQFLNKNHLKIAFAESITGGAISDRFVSVAGASQIFDGSVVAYSNKAKHKLLGVNPKTISSFGVVSSQVAEEMLVGVQKLFDCNCAIATTGFAGPQISSEKVGKVIVACVVNDKKRIQELFLDGDRKSIVDQTVEAAIALLNYFIQEEINVR
jgi:nicotinamide-nucleotide amidase